MNPGIYAWYYAPINITKDEFRKQLESLCPTPARTTSETRFDYGLSYQAKTWSQPRFSESIAGEAIQSLLDSIDFDLRDAFTSFMAPFFTRPIYIGIASYLRSRLYEQHYKKLIEYWEPDNVVSRFVDANASLPPAKILELFKQQFGSTIPGSFAIRARIKGFYAADLIAYYVETETTLTPKSGSVVASKELRRMTERILQMISLPVCGRN